MPKFTIIAGAYNHEKTLPRLKESLDCQTFRDFEVILADDGSRDFTLALAESYGWKWTTQKHRGMRLAKSLNRAIKKAKGDYILLVMGDSFLESDYLEVLDRWVKPCRVVCGVRFQVDGDRMVDMDYRLFKGHIPPENALLSGQAWKLTTGNGLCVPTEAFRECGYLNEGFEGYGGEDNEIVMRLFHRGYTTWSVPDLKLYHNWHPAQDAVKGNGSRIFKLAKAYAR